MSLCRRCCFSVDIDDTDSDRAKAFSLRDGNRVISPLASVHAGIAVSVASGSCVKLSPSAKTICVECQRSFAWEYFPSRFG